MWQGKGDKRMENPMIRKKKIDAKSRPLTEAILVAHLKRFEERLEGRFEGMEERFKRIEERLDGMEERLDGMDKKFEILGGKIEFVRQDFKEHLESVERRLTLRIVALEQKVSSIYEELKFTQIAVREVKSEGLENTKRLERIEKDHGQRLERIEQVEQDHGARLKRIEEKVERLAA